MLTAISANGRIPAIIDRTPTPEGKTREKRVFEGQAIMLYLCQKYDKDYKISFPFNSDKSFSLLSIFLEQSLTERQVLGSNGMDDLDAKRTRTYARPSQSFLPLRTRENRICYQEISN